MKLFISLMTATLAFSAPAFAQTPGEVQQMVWSCNAAASDRGLQGKPRERFVQKCINEAGGGVSDKKSTNKKKG
jgi:hypothetical protein